MVLGTYLTELLSLDVWHLSHQCLKPSVDALQASPLVIIGNLPLKVLVRWQLQTLWLWRPDESNKMDLYS